MMNHRSKNQQEYLQLSIVKNILVNHDLILSCGDYSMNVLATPMTRQHLPSKQYKITQKIKST